MVMVLWYWQAYNILLPSWQKEVMFLVVLVCLFVCLFLSNITQKVMNTTLQWKVYGEVRSGTRKNWLNFSIDLDLLRWVNDEKNHNNNCSMTWSWCSDPEALGLALHHQGPTFINAYCQVNRNWEQYQSHDLPRQRKSALSEYFHLVGSHDYWWEL